VVYGIMKLFISHWLSEICGINKVRQMI